MLEQGESSLSEEKAEAETMCDAWSITPSPFPTGGEEVENWAVKLSPGRRERWEKVFLGLRVYFSL